MSNLSDVRCPKCSALLFKHGEQAIPRVEIKCRRCGGTISFPERQKASEPPERPI